MSAGQPPADEPQAGQAGAPAAEQAFASHDGSLHVAPANRHEPRPADPSEAIDADPDPTAERNPLADVIHLLLRRLRIPLIVLIVVYGVAIFGLTVAPGVDPDGQPWRMTFFHAIYVMSYTATTIGFGEIPFAFSDAQRAWMTVCIYLSVTAWAYALGTIFAMTSDPTFRAGFARAVFRWRVAGLGEPFYVVVGAGQSGWQLARALDEIGHRVVLIDIQQERAIRAALSDYRQPPLILTADARTPAVLADAGLNKTECRGLIALSDDDEVNQTVAIGARVLRSDIAVVARVLDDLSASILRGFGDITVINPHQAFATNIGLDLKGPVILQMEDWLTNAPGTPCPEQARIPPGPWVLAGFGRLGQAIARELDEAHVEWHALDPDPRLPREARLLAGDNTEAALLAAGIDRAAVFVAGTDRDSVNLGLTVLARRLNPSLAAIVRENRVADRVLIDAAHPAMRYVKSNLVVRECLQILNTPLLNLFLQHVRDTPPERVQRGFDLLRERLGSAAPLCWAFDCDPAAPGLADVFGTGAHRRRGTGDAAPERAMVRAPDQAPARPAGAAHRTQLKVRHLLLDPMDRDGAPLEVVVLMIRRGDELNVLPHPDDALLPGDRLLCAGHEGARSWHARYANDARLFDWVVTGIDRPQTWLFRRLARATARD